jgi:general secretion pathway protein A
MYHHYFGLNEAPFSIAVNPRYLFMSARHRDALAHLLYGVGAGGGFILLTGEVGTGKTTVTRCLLEQLPPDTDIAMVLNPALNAIELLATVCDELGIAYDHHCPTLKTLTDKLHRFLLDNHARRRRTVLLIDEAQHLDFEVLEQIRLLTNLETNSEKLLQILLVGQPELTQMLARPELRQLNQRITARYNLESLNLEETGAYIKHRLQVAGMTPGRQLFPRAVVRGIHRRTRGIPRLINTLCDRMLLGAYGRNRSRADAAMLRLAAREVLGEERKAGRRGLRLGSALALPLLAAGGWWLLQGSARVDGPALNGEAAVVSGPQAGRAAVVLSPPPQERAPEPPAPAPLVPDAGEESSASGWLLPPAIAMARIWALHSGEPFSADPCNGSAVGDVACIEGESQSWDELARLDRPLLLELVTAERFLASALLLGVDGRHLWVGSMEGAVQRVGLDAVAPHWTGRYRFLWHPPPGYQRSLFPGAEGPAVTEVAQLFARLDGQPRPLTETRYNAALRQRVRLFQREHGLVDDGVVGVQTLLELNRQLGVDLDAAGARRLLGGEGEEVVSR